MSMLTEEVSKQKMLETIHYMTENFPYRLAGSPCEAAASRYVTERLRQYGLEVENKEFYTYNSDPMYSKVTVLDPAMEIDSLPCAHIRATKPEGEVFELIYVGNGDYASYKDINVKGKMVLVEVSYAPPVPEKARIAYEMGAAGIMCMNWGNDEEVICRRGLKGVWGNPTEANFHCIPEIVGVGVTRGAGLKLKQLCLEGKKVEVKVTAIADRTWSIVHQPTAILRGNGKSDEFLLVCSHLDAWKPGVTCNATGNATTLEICRILSKHRQELDRDVYFVFWDGHEVAEAAGSTWFVDNNWDKLNKHCVCYMHIDSTGVKETELYEIKASEELLSFAKKNINDVLPELELRAMALKKIGDQSFMGIGVSSITQRKSFTKEYIKYISKRLLMMIPVLLGVILLVFIVMNLASGNAVMLILGDNATEEAVQQKTEELGLDKPLLVRYANYVIGLLHGDMGKSYISNRSVADEVFQRFPNTLKLAIVSAVISTLLALPLGVFAAVKQNTLFDNCSMIISLLGNSMPAFWLALMMMMLFSEKLGWLPSQGMRDGWLSYVLPAFSIGFINMAAIARTTRSTVLETIRQDYIFVSFLSMVSCLTSFG